MYISELQEFNKKNIEIISIFFSCIQLNFFYILAVTLDYKALVLLLQKSGDEEFVLGGKGYDKEFCAFCDAIRVRDKTCNFIHAVGIILFWG